MEHRDRHMIGMVNTIMIREAKQNDLEELLQLYLDLHVTNNPEDSKHLRNTWDTIINDPNRHLIICEIDGRIAASCVCNYSKSNKKCKALRFCGKCSNT